MTRKSGFFDRPDEDVRKGVLQEKEGSGDDNEAVQPAAPAQAQGVSDRKAEAAECLRADEVWLIVGLPQDVVGLLVATTRLDRKLPPVVLDSRGRLRRGSSVVLGRALADVILRDAGFWRQVVRCYLTGGANIVGMPLVVSRARMDALLAALRMEPALPHDVPVASANSQTNSVSQAEAAAPQSVASVSGSAAKRRLRLSLPGIPRKTLKWTGFAILCALALVGLVAVVGMVMMERDKAAQAASVDAEAQTALADATGGADLDESVFEPPLETDEDEQTAQAGTQAAPLPPPEDIEVVLGRGNKRLFVFSDPLCPFCKALEPALDRLAKQGYEVHIFPTPLPIHPQAARLVAGIACAKDKVKAWKNAVEKGEAAPATCEAAKSAPERALAFYRQFGFNATPTLINEAGKVQVGALPYEALLKFVEEE